MKNKPVIPMLFFILVYLNQGLSSFPTQSLYYLLRESWLLSATTLSLISFITGFPWYIKFLFGAMQDRFPIKGYSSKYYLIINYILILVTCGFIITFGLNLVTLIMCGLIRNICIASADVANDKQMVILEQKHNLSGKIQACQWSAMGIGGLIVALGGAWIAKTFPEPFNYKVAYALTMIVPIFTLYYLMKHYKEDKVPKSYKPPTLKGNWKFIKDKAFLFGLAFIACLNFCPSFGLALQIQMREVLHIDKMFLGWLGATGTVLGLIGYGIYYKICDKFSMRKLLYFTVIFSAITNLFYLYIPNQWFIMAYSVMFGAFGGICFLSLLTYMSKIVPKGSEGLFYALVVSVNNLSAQLGNVFGGFCYDHFGYSINVIISTITTLACLYFIPRLDIKDT